MPKGNLSFPRILTMVVFALSCFGLLMFLWLSFGGTVPLKPHGYRANVAFPEAVQLGLEADVRIAGVSVGKVRRKRLDDDNNKTIATLEIEHKYAPIDRDARAILRQKTLLGETYVELSPGTKPGEKLPEDGRLPDGQVQQAVELDEIFSALDPQTRDAFRRWQQDLGEAVEHRGRDLNEAFGSLAGFVEDGSDVLQTLDRQDRAVQQLVRNTGHVFEALTRREDQLRNLITNSADVFEATASQNDALAETFRIFPTFLDESRVTMRRLRTFSQETHPLVRELIPVAQDLRPTLRDLRALAPDLRDLFRALDPLITASDTGLPALRDVLTGARPLLRATGGFLRELNPVLEYLEQHQHDVSDFISQGGPALADTTVSRSGIGHYLRQFGVTGSETLAIYRERLPTNRGNAYFEPQAYFGPKGGEFLIFPNFDCRNAGGEVKSTPPPGPGQSGRPGCFVQGKRMFQNRLQGQFPHVQREDYGKGRR